MGVMTQCTQLEKQFSGFCDAHHRKGKVANRCQLFHGTVRESAKSIIQEGFRLPSYGGMFGKGVYFARTPLKSKQYIGWLGCLLLCEVELGNSKVQQTAKANLRADTIAIGIESYD